MTITIDSYFLGGLIFWGLVYAALSLLVAWASSLWEQS